MYNVALYSCYANMYISCTYNVVFNHRSVSPGGICSPAGIHARLLHGHQTVPQGRLCRCVSMLIVDVTELCVLNTFCVICPGEDHGQSVCL